MQNINYAFLLSRPVWGAWIEILMKLVLYGIIVSRAPYGARGLKLSLVKVVLMMVESRPVWGAWIEI